MMPRRLLLLALHASAQIALSPTSTTRVRVFGEDVIAYDARDKIFADVMAHGAAWEPDTAALLAALLAPGDGAIDVGAHVGTNALTMARAVGDAGVVVALEPQRAVHQLLCASVALSGVSSSVVALWAAAGDGADAWFEAPVFTRAAWARNIMAVGIGAEGVIANGELGLRTLERVRALSVDAIVAAHLEGRCPRLIKIDVEGFERAVLAGARDTLARCRPMLLVEVLCRRAVRRALSLLEPAGYACWWDPKPAFDNGTAGASAVRAPLHWSMDMLCAPAEARGGADARLAALAPMTPLAPGQSSPNDRPDRRVRTRARLAEFMDVPNFDDPQCSGQIDTSIWDNEERAEPRAEPQS